MDTWKLGRRMLPSIPSSFSSAGRRGKKGSAAILVGQLLCVNHVINKTLKKKEGNVLVSRVQSVEKIEHWFNVLRSKAALILIKSADRTLHWQWGALHRRDQTQSGVSARKLLSLLISATHCSPITAGKQIISRKRVLQACTCLMRWLVRKWPIKNRKWR